MFINLFDSHTHSDNSFDGHHSITFMCERAVEKGLSGICITDHCELRDFRKQQYGQRIMQSVFETRKSKVVFNGRIAVSSGVELSDVLFEPELTDKVIARFPFDMVMVSQHNTNSGEDIYYFDFSSWSGAAIHQYLQDYFAYLLQAVQTAKFDVVGHLTYPLRYITGRDGVPVNMARYTEVIDEILRTVAQTGKAIEINTSGLATGWRETMPAFQYVRRFRELGGEYITLGSDSHAADTLGAGIEQAMQMLLDAEFRYFTFYKERQPLQLKLI